MKKQKDLFEKIGLNQKASTAVKSALIKNLSKNSVTTQSAPIAKGTQLEFSLDESSIETLPQSRRKTG